MNKLIILMSLIFILSPVAFAQDQKARSEELVETKFDSGNSTEVADVMSRGNADRRLADLERKISDIERQLSRLDDRLDNMESDFRDMERRISR